MRRLIQQKSIQAFTKRGVPHSVLLAPWAEHIEKLMGIIEIPKSSQETTIINKDAQQKAIEGLKKVVVSDDTRSSGKLLIFAAREIDHLPNQLALSIAAFVIENNKDFVWHSVMGGLRDKIRDDDTPDERMKTAKLFVISNLTETSGNLKVEKTRDLLTQYSMLNRIVVVAGINPAVYAKTILRMKADAFVWF